ncbi:hypothetical protein GGI35DRAFT_42777 [Trichoderma velutinum]
MSNPLCWKLLVQAIGSPHGSSTLVSLLVLLPLSAPGVALQLLCLGSHQTPIPSHTGTQGPRAGGQGKEARRITSIEPAGSCKPWLASRLGADQGRCRADKHCTMPILKSRGRKEGDRQIPLKRAAGCYSAIEAQYQKGMSACALHRVGLALLGSSPMDGKGRRASVASALSPQAE